MSEPKKRRSGPSGPSGANIHPAITLRLDREGQREEWEAAAERAGLKLTPWIRKALDAAARRQK